MFDKNDLIDALGGIDDSQLQRYSEEKERLTVNRRESPKRRSFNTRKIAVLAALIALIALTFVLLIPKTGKTETPPDTSASGSRTIVPKTPDPETIPEGPIYLMRVVVCKDPDTGAVRTSYETSGVFIYKRGDEFPKETFLPLDAKEGGYEEYIIPVQFDLYSVNCLVNHSTVISESVPSLFIPPEER